MSKCSVKKCVNNSRTALKKDGVSYFSFPWNAIRCSEWTSIIAKDRREPFYKPYKGSVVCSKHFLPSDIYTTVKGFRRLAKNAKPILNMSYDQSNCSEDISNLDALEESISSSHSTTSATQESVLQGESSLQQDQNEFFDVESQLIENPVVFNFQASCPQNSLKSPTTSLSVGSILDTSRKTILKKRLLLCEKIIQRKNKKINKLEKQNNRLIKENISLKKAMSILKKRKGIDDRSLSYRYFLLTVTILMVTF